MAEIAVTTVIEKLMSLVDEEARLLGGIHNQVEDIKIELLYIQAFLKDADAKSDTVDISHGLKTWIQDLRKTAYSMEDLIDEYMLHFANRNQNQNQNPRRWFFGFPGKVARSIQKLKPRHEMASKIRDIKKKIDKLKETGSSYVFIASSVEPESSSSTATAPWHDQRVTSLFVDETEIVGIDPQRNELITQLVEEGNPKRTVISVVGMGGLGKTTLTKKVYDNWRVVGHFDCHAWITVSQSFKMEELIRNMTKKFYQGKKEAVPEGIDTIDEMSLITLIRQYLQDKRYVVVFDDVWKLDFWGFIKYVLPENGKGSRIIITTRNDEVASSCIESSFDFIHKMQPLSPKSSWELFCKKTFQGGCPPELEKFSLDIVKRCGGLPLAIVTIGGLLSRKQNVREWENFSDNLGSELESNSRLQPINTILSLSYHDLPHYLKTCFLYLAIFPEDYTIKCANLTRLWIAEGFVKAKGGVTMEEIAEEFLIELIHRSLVQVSDVDLEGKIKSCHIHDLMREMILKKAEELSFCHVLTGEGPSFDGKSRRLSVHNSTNKILDTIDENCSHVRSIFLFNSEMIFTKTLASKLKLVKVLDLKDSPIQSVPEDLGNLFHLKYLSLRNTRVKILPKSIGKLRNLQTLDLKHSLIEELPVEINKLQKLHHILAYNYNFDVEFSSASVKGVHVKEGISSLEDLQKLCFMEANHGADVIIELGKLRQLRKLGITKLTRENGQPLCASITNMNHLKSLSISSSTEDEILDLQHLSDPPPCLSRLELYGRLDKLPDWISKLKSLVKLGLWKSRFGHDPMEVLGALPSLLELELLETHGIEQICFEAIGFQKLKVLRMCGLMELKKVKMENGALPQLEELEIGPSSKLEEVPDGICYLRKLKTLSFRDMPAEFKLSFIPGRGRNYGTVEHIPNVFFYQRLSGQHYTVQLAETIQSLLLAAEFFQTAIGQSEICQA